MSMIQKLLKKLLPVRWSSDMEAVTRKWMLQCKCGHETNLWDAGGVRYKATGSKRTMYRCPTCGVTLHKLYYRGEETTPLAMNETPKQRTAM